MAQTLPAAEARHTFLRRKRKNTPYYLSVDLLLRASKACLTTRARVGRQSRREMMMCVPNWALGGVPERVFGFIKRLGCCPVFSLLQTHLGQEISRQVSLRRSRLQQKRGPPPEPRYLRRAAAGEENFRTRSLAFKGKPEDFQEKREETATAGDTPKLGRGPKRGPHPRKKHPRCCFRSL